jgi:hypothetical protein
MDLSRSRAARAVLAIVLMIGYYALALAVSAALIWIPYAEFRYLERVDFRIGIAVWQARQPSSGPSCRDLIASKNRGRS